MYWINDIRLFQYQTEIFFDGSEDDMLNLNELNSPTN